MPIRTKRVYDDPSPDDGYRVLIDRLWPRGVKKEDLGADEWLKDAAPSNELRKWFHQQPTKWAEFRLKYLAELRKNNDALADLRGRLDGGETVTLLYGSRNAERNHALVLRDFLLGEAP